MAIKLQKICRELGIALSNVIEDCKNLGYEVVMDLNTRIDDDLYIQLKRKYGVEVKEEVEEKRFFAESPKEKVEVEPISIETPNIEVKILGKIDLPSAPSKSKTKKTTSRNIKKTEITVEEEVKEMGKEEEKEKKQVKEKKEREVKKKEDKIVEEVKEVKKEEELVEEKAVVKEVEVVAEEKKPKEDPIIENIPIEKPSIKIVGTIDIDKLPTKKSKTKRGSKDEKPKKEEKVKKEEVVVEESTTQVLSDVKEEPKTEESKAEESTPVKEDTGVGVKEDIGDVIYRIPVPEVVSQPKILGKLDLSSINAAMRPARKTKEEKMKEREAKFNQQHKLKSASDSSSREGVKKRTGMDVSKSPTMNNNKVEDIETSSSSSLKGDGVKRKRERIRSNKVDISSEQHIKYNKNKYEKKNYRIDISSESVQQQVKETYSRLNSGKGKTAASKHKRERRELERERIAEAQAEERASSKILKLTEFVTANDLAVMMNIPVNKVIGTCMTLGILVSINQRLDAETINIVAEEFGFTTEYVNSKLVESINTDEVVRDEDIETRCPIVTVMGHVDHGKTSLLDHIRNTNVIAGEAGGITQHIGAYNVELKNGQHITFLDTPGHEAFTAMRARGTKITDIAIIVIAADDAVMPQTIEAINHAQAANVPMIFAINKCDKPGANPDKILEQLANMNILVESWGGKYQSQNISAKRGDGVYELLEKVLLEAEMLDLKANPKRRAKGTIVESSLDKGRGYVATVLVSDGTLHMGDIILAGTYHGKVKAMFNERGKHIESVLPGEPCSLLGFNGAPQAGDEFNVLSSEHEARAIANKREQLQREQSIRTRKHLGLEEIGRRLAIGDFKELNIIVKGDVDGSVEALTDSLLKLSTENIQVNVIHGAVGAISDSDVLLAEASDAIIIGFNVRPTATAKKMAELEEVDIRIYSIIYDAIDNVKAAMSGMLSPEIKEEVTATVEVLQTFHISKVGTIAGCIVRDGKAKRTNRCRLIRDGIVIHTGEISSLKRVKDDVKEVGVNQECGISIKSFNDIRVGDIIETYEQVEVSKTIA